MASQEYALHMNRNALQLHEFQQHLRLSFILWGMNLRTYRIQKLSTGVCCVSSESSTSVSQSNSCHGPVSWKNDTTWDKGMGRTRIHCRLFNGHEIELQAFQHRRKEKCSWTRARLFTAKQSTHIATLSVKLNTVKLTLFCCAVKLAFPVISWEKASIEDNVIFL